MAALAGLALALGLPAVAHATVIAGNSSAFGESVNLTVTPIVGPAVNITSGPFPAVSGAAPPPFSLSNSALSASVANVLSTGLLVVNANSNVDGSLGSKSAAANSTVNGLTIGVAGLTLSATTLQSLASVNGDFGFLTGTGSAMITGLSINGSSAVSITPTANDVLLNAGGIEVTANQQIFSGNGTSNRGIIDNALDITFSNVLGTIGADTGLITGEIIISQSEAFLSAAAPASGGGSGVPEPATWLVFGAGLLGFGCHRLRRRGMGAEPPHDRPDPGCLAA
jgi:PEP-CTERM motif-containing protein